MRARVLLLVMFAALMGCRDRAPALQAATNSAAKPAAYPFKMRAEGASPVAVSFFADGQQIHVVPPRKSHGVDEISFSTATESPVITAKARLECGWQEVRLEELFVRRAPRFGPEGKLELPGLIHLRFRDDIPREDFVVDNRGRAATTLRLGATEALVAADSFDRVSIVASDCARGTDLAFGTTAIGRIGAPSGANPKPATYLVDPTGKRCYERRYVAYGKPAKDEPPAKRATHFRRKVLHQLHDRLEQGFWFGDAPPRIETFYRMGERPKGLVYQVVMREATCARAEDDD